MYNFSSLLSVQVFQVSSHLTNTLYLLLFDYSHLDTAMSYLRVLFIFIFLILNGDFIHLKLFFISKSDFGKRFPLKLKLFLSNFKKDYYCLCHCIVEFPKILGEVTFKNYLFKYSFKGLESCKTGRTFFLQQADLGLIPESIDLLYFPKSDLWDQRQEKVLGNTRYGSMKQQHDFIIHKNLYVFLQTAFRIIVFF